MPTTAQTLDTNYLSSVPFLNKRDILNKVLNLNYSEGFLDFMEMMGRSVPTKNVEYHHFVSGSLYANGKVRTNPISTGTKTKGSKFNIQLQSNDVIPVVGEIFKTKDYKYGRVNKIIDKSNKIFEAMAISTFTTTSLPPNDTLVFFTSASPEGGTPNKMRTSELTKVMSNIQKIETKFEVTDLAAFTQSEVSFGGTDYFYYKQQHDAIILHKLKTQYAFLEGPGGYIEDDDGNKVYMIKGVRTDIAENGVNHSTATAGTVSLNDLSKFSLKLDKARAGTEFFQLDMPQFANAYDLGLSREDPFKAGGVTYNAFKGNKDMALHFGFKTIGAFGRTFHRKRMDAFSNYDVIAPVDSYKGDRESLFIPTGQVKTEKEGMVDRLRTRYMVMPKGITSKYQEIRLGLFADKPTTDEGIGSITYKSTEGIDVLGIDHFGKMSLDA